MKKISMIVFLGVFLLSGCKGKQGSENTIQFMESETIMSKAQESEIGFVEIDATETIESKHSREETTELTEGESSEEAETTSEKSFFPPDALEECEAGTVIREEDISWENIESYFQIYQISDSVYARINGKSFQEGELISREDLRYVKVLHYNYDHQIQVGELMVCAEIAEDYQGIMKELFAEEYEIYSMYLVDRFWTGDADETDTASMTADNTSSFCYRVVAGSTKLSNHAMGRAIDINPFENPYVTYPNGEIRISPPGSESYADRNSNREHMIQKGDVCYQIFQKYGFTWGGTWNSSKDYQHFQKKK